MPFSSWSLRVAVTVALAWGAAVHADATPTIPTARFHRVADGAITLDGRLDERAWSRAPAITRFYEVFPGDDTPPRATTTARFLYDHEALYIGVRLDEPDPPGMRTQFVERDRINGAQDYVYVYIDGLGSGRGTQFFAVDVRGVETDGYYSETSEAEDNAPDYRWDVATSRDAHGWTAEFRIPFSTLRHVADGSRWKVLVYRGRPRANYLQDASAPIPRGASCFVCFLNPVQGLESPAPHPHWLVTPEAVVQAGAPVHGFKPDFGVTARWQAGGGRSIDLTVNPDFSEVEADAIQVTGNARFVQSLPEKRPFFMQSLDLLAVPSDLDRPLQPVYTRDIADPDLGIRYTQRAAGHDFTTLVARDAGGGGLLLPGPYVTGEIPATRESDDLVARYARNLHGLAIGGVVTDREYQGGGFNRIMGADANWHPTPSDNVNAEWLGSSTRDGAGSAAASTQVSASRQAAAGYAEWNHLGDRWTWDVLLQQVGDGFRADLGFVPAAGFREARADLGLRRFDVGAFSELRPVLTAEEARALDGNETIVRSVYPGLYLRGPRGLNGTVELHFAEAARADAGLPLRNYRFARVNLAMQPGARWPLAMISGDIGQQLDLATGAVRPGGSLALESDFQPVDRLEFDLSLTRAWLRANAQDHTPKASLLEQHGEQLIARLHLSIANELRLQAFRQRDMSVSEGATRTWATSLLFLHHAGRRRAWYVGVSRNDDPRFPTQRGWELLAKWTYSYGG